MTTKKDAQEKVEPEVAQEKVEPEVAEETDCSQNEKPGVVFESLSRRDVSSHIVHSHMMGSIAAAAVLRIPGVNFAAVAAIQLKMLRSISRVYDVPFKKEAARAVIGSLIGAALPATVGKVALIGGNAVPGAVMQKLPAVLQGALPALGSLLGIVAMPAIAGATTYAVGRIFVSHFESGGTLLDFDAKKHVASFKEAFRRGKKKTAEAEPVIVDEAAAGEPAPATA